MAKFAGYGFNKSHAVAYSYVAYQTAYLKAHYPAEFMAANMCLILTDSDKIRTFIDDCKLRGISILPPDINQSDWFFTAPDSKTIRYGLGGIKGVGEGVILSLMAERKENGPFKDLFDLCARMKKRDSAGLSRRVLEGLIKAGTLDTIDPDRAKQFGNLDQAMKAAADAALFADQGSLFGDASEPERIVNWIPVTPWSEHEKLLLEKEVIGFCLTGHLFGECRDEIRKFIPETIHQILASGRRPAPGAKESYRSKDTIRFSGVVVDLRQVIGKRGRMGIVTLDDGTGSIEAVCYSDAWDQYRDIFVKDEIVIVTGRSRWDEKKETTSFSIDSAESLPGFRTRRHAALHIEVSEEPDLKEIAKTVAPFENSKYGCQLVFCIDTHGMHGQVVARRPAFVDPQQEVIDQLLHVSGVRDAHFVYS